MKKRMLSILLSVLLIMSVLTPISGYAAGTSSDGLVAADSIKADTDSVKFTHKEWTGNDYTDLSGNNVNGEDVFGIAREDSTVPRIPYASAEQAAKYAWDYDVRKESPYFKLLTGEGEPWTLTVVQNQDLAKEFYDAEDNFMQADYVEDPADGWKEISLPMSWTSQGFDFSIYSNITMPFQTRYDPNVQCPNAPTVYNPVGLYRKYFQVDADFLNAGRRVYISFQGVESAYYVYINGKEVGYSEDSYSPHRFDITDYLTVGENFLAVKVHKFCDGTWFEDQDMLYDGGIFRDIYLTSEPVVKIEDYHYTTDFDANFKDAVLTVSADVRNLSSKDHEGWTIDVQAIDTDGTDILGGTATIPVASVDSTETATVTANFDVASPKQWSDEKPNLYCLVLSLKDGDGNVVEVLSTQLGFREINFTSTQIDATGRNTTTSWIQPTINGKRLLILGANRHDSDPIYGKATRQEVIDMDFEILKQNNFNAFRTSHYSNDEYFYWKANQIGAYIMAETNLECHGINGNEGYVQLFKEIMLDRTETTFMRLRSNPAIFCWSLGNESGYIDRSNYDNGNYADGAFLEVIQYFKNNDPTRMVHYEGMRDENITFGVDVYSDMYRSPNDVDNRGDAGKLPYIQCEYAHSMGNSTGDLNGWYQEYLDNPNAMGGFIWDFVDQARAVELEEVESITDKTGVKGTAAQSGDIWKENAGAGSLNGGYSTTAGFNFQASKYNQYLSGTGKSFTVEVITKPTTKDANQVFLTKGDNQFALKTQPNGGGLEFFVYNNGWNSLNVDYPANWENNWHQIVGVYDKGNMKVYIDGNLAGQATYADNINASNIPVGVGYDNSNGRDQDGEISIARIYTMALTADQIAAQNSANPAIGPDDDSILLWVDYSDEHTTATEGWDYFSEEFAHVTDLFAEDMKGKYMAYGGDWGDYPNDGNYPQNGIVSADRDLQSDMYNAKGVYKRIEFAAEDLDQKEFTVTNHMYWTNLNEYDVEWRVYDNGILYKSGNAGTIDLAPQTTRTVTVPFELPAAKDGHEYFVDLVVKQKADHVDWAEEGYEQHHQQFQVVASIDQVPQTINTNVTVAETDTAYEISGEKFSFSISKADGRIKNYVYDGDLLIEDGPAASFWRCRTDNDKNSFDANWMNKDQNIRVDSITVGTGEKGLPVITATIKFPDAGQTTETIRYTVNGNGEITVDVSVNGNGSGLGNFIRVGTTSVIPAGFEDVFWYGLGPWDTFADKKDYATQAIWKNTVSGIFYPFESIDDCGTMLDTAWIALKNEDVDTALLVASKNRIEVSAMHFTAYDLEAAQHPYELSPRAETILALNYGSLGIGTASLGRGPIESTHLPSNRVYDWNFTFIPVPADSTDAELAEAAMPYHVAESRYNFDDQSKNDLDTLSPTTATMVDLNGERNMKGYFQVQDDAKVLNNALSGRNEWTIEVVATPNNNAGMNILASMGDNAIQLRTRDGGYLEGHIYAGGAWRDCKFTIPAEEQAAFFGQEHQLAFSYIPADAGDIDGDGDVEEGILQLFIDGVLRLQTATNTAQGVNKLDYPLGIGYDEQTNRVNAHNGFAQVRVYSKALTAEELVAQYAGEYVYTAESDEVELWIDFTKANDNDDVIQISYDVNDDGKVDVMDILTLKEWALSVEAPTPERLTRADFNGDGKLNVVDIILLRSYILKMP